MTASASVECVCVHVCVHVHACRGWGSVSGSSITVITVFFFFTFWDKTFHGSWRHWFGKTSFPASPRAPLSQLLQCSDYRSRLAHLTFYVNARNPCSSFMLMWQTLYQWAFSPTHQYDFYYRILKYLFYLIVTVDNFLLLNLQIKLYCWSVHKGNNPDICRVWYVVVSGIHWGAWNRTLVDKEMTPFLIWQSKLVVLCGFGASFVICFLRKSHEHFYLERVFPHFNHNPFRCQEWRFAITSF